MDYSGLDYDTFRQTDWCVEWETDAITGPHCNKRARRGDDEPGSSEAHQLLPSSCIWRGLGDAADGEAHPAAAYRSLGDDASGGEICVAYRSLGDTDAYGM